MITETSHKFIVTGASSGIGYAIAESLLRHNHKVIGISRRPASELIDFKHYTPVTLDLADLATLPDAFTQLAADHPDVYGAVFCAGAGRFGSLEEFSYQQIQQSINLNLISPIYLARALLPALKRNGRGQLIFIGSESALSGGKRGAVYCAGKFGLRGLAQSLRQEGTGRNIKVCIVNPGMVKTDFFAELDFTHGDAAENFILPEDVADAVIAVVSARPETVIEEINLSPLKKVIQPK